VVSKVWKDMHEESIELKEIVMIFIGISIIGRNDIMEEFSEGNDK